jgi:hypothetical protein
LKLSSKSPSGSRAPKLDKCTNEKFARLACATRSSPRRPLKGTPVRTRALGDSFAECSGEGAPVRRRSDRSGSGPTNSGALNRATSIRSPDLISRGRARGCAGTGASLRLRLCISNQWRRQDHHSDHHASECVRHITLSPRPRFHSRRRDRNTETRNGRHTHSRRRTYHIA